MGGGLMEYLLPSGQLNVYQCYAYSVHPQISPHQVSRFFLVYPQADVKSDIFMDLPIGFGAEEVHPREWVFILAKTYMS